MSLFRTVFSSSSWNHFKLLSNNKQLIRRCIFDEKLLKLDFFRKEVAFHKRKYLKSSDKDKLVKEFAKSIKTKSTDESSYSQLNALLYLSQNQTDLDLVVAGVKQYKRMLKQNQIPTNQFNGLGSNLMRAVYVLNDSKRGLQYLNDKDLEPIFKHASYPRLILMNKLMLEKNFELVVEMFDAYLRIGFRPDVNKAIQRAEPNKFYFPHDQFSLVTMALLKINTPKALQKMKQIVDSIELKNLEYCNILVTRCFLLAINQNDPEYGLKLTKKFANLHSTIGFNLTAIAFAQLGLVSEALRAVQNMIELNFDPNPAKIHGKFFPSTIEKVRLAIGSADTSHAEKINLFKTMIEKDKRFLPYDIYEYVEKEIIQNKK